MSPMEILNADEIAALLLAAQERADASGEPEPCGFVARYADGTWVSTDGFVSPTVAHTRRVASPER